MRHEVMTHLIGEEVNCKIHGLYLTKAHQLSDSTLQINHFEPHGFSEQKYKGVTTDEARAVFQGKTYVDKKAQKTDGYQLHHALLLSKRAEVYSKPELEIYADDVKCSHGSATNHLDQDMLFYMRARGISQKESYALIISAYLSSMLEECDNDEVKAFAAEMITLFISEKSWGADD
jgi:Fe-S cluster assembly protein SufD